MLQITPKSGERSCARRADSGQQCILSILPEMSNETAKAVETERDRPRFIGCKVDIFASRPPTSRESPAAPGGPHLRAVNLIHEVGRNLPGPRSHNDSLAIRYEPSEIATDAGNDI